MKTGCLGTFHFTSRISEMRNARVMKSEAVILPAVRGKVVKRRYCYTNKLGRNPYSRKLRELADLRLLAGTREHRSLVRSYIDDKTGLGAPMKQKLERALEMIKADVKRIPLTFTDELIMKLAGATSSNDAEYEEIVIINKMTNYFKKEQVLFPKTNYFDIKRVRLIREGCIIIREWVGQDDNKPASMFMTSLATMRELFISDDLCHKQLLWYGLQRLRETFQNESNEVLGQWALCYKNHEESWRQLNREAQDIEDTVRYRILSVNIVNDGESMSMRERLQLRQQFFTQIRQQLRGQFLVPKCCLVLGTTGAKCHDKDPTSL